MKVTVLGNKVSADLRDGHAPPGRGRGGVGRQCSIPMAPFQEVIQTQTQRRSCDTQNRGWRDATGSQGAWEDLPAKLLQNCLLFFVVCFWLGQQPPAILLSLFHDGTEVIGICGYLVGPELGSLG